MDPWYESSGPAEVDVEHLMQNSRVYLCLHKEVNSVNEDDYLRDQISLILFPLSSSKFRTITYASIRSNPNWKKLSNVILREEVVKHKPYGSWRGFSTFVMSALTKIYIERLVREVWATHILQTQFVPIWVDYNYLPDKTRLGYCRVRDHYYNSVKM